MPSPERTAEASTSVPGGRLDRPRSPLRETLRIVLPYVAVAALWIYFSDDLVSRLTDDPRRIAFLSTIKGWGFVATTGGLLGALLFRLLRGLSDVQAALRESEEQYRLMAENTGDVIWLLDLATRRFLYVSPSVVRLLGYTPEEMLRRTVADVLTPASLALADRVLPGRVAALAAGDESQRTMTHELDQVRRDGRTVSTEIVTTLLVDDSGRATRLLGVTRDLTERRRAERGRQEAEEQRRIALDAAELGTWRHDVDAGTIHFDERGRAHYGLDADTVTVAEARARIHPDDVARMEHDMRTALDPAVSEGRYATEYRVLHAGGEVRWLAVQARVYFEGEGDGRRMLLRIGTSQDITARRKSEEGLRRYELLAGQSRDVILFVRREDGRILEANAAATLTYGYSREELLARTVWELRAPESREATAEQMARADTEGLLFETIHRRKDGTDVPVEVSARGAVVDGTRMLVSVIRDITERRRAEDERARLEAELFQAQKMESVGRLAGGVAHDFNNMLSVIVGRAELALLRGVPEGPLRADLDEILTTAERSAELTHQLLAFARKQTVSPRLLRLNDAVFDTLKMLRRLLGEDVTLVWNPGADVGTVRIDPSQLDQVLANLAVNARDAIAGHGTLTLETSTAQLDATDWPGQPGFVPGPYVVLTVSDTGAGMEREVLRHAFEPFFTTKGPGRGTGLGLATVFGIVRQHGGFIDVRSEPGRGTSFRICLPRAGGEEAASAPGAKTAGGSGGSETILLVEDEESILDVVGTMLEGAGYRVLLGRGPSEALRVAVGYPGPIHLLLTDVVMPGMNGRELAARLRELRPDTKCLFMSGYTADVIARRGMLDEGVCLIAKPLRRGELLAAVRRALAAPQEPPPLEG